jgi:hypothetical protein
VNTTHPDTVINTNALKKMSCKNNTYENASINVLEKKPSNPPIIMAVLRDIFVFLANQITNNRVTSIVGRMDSFIRFVYRKGEKRWKSKNEKYPLFRKLKNKRAPSNTKLAKNA